MDSRKAVYQDKTCIMFSVGNQHDPSSEKFEVANVSRFVCVFVSLMSCCATPYAEMTHHYMWQGTVVTAGRARAIVIGTGAQTAIGKIHDAMTDQACVHSTMLFRLIKLQACCMLCSPCKLVNVTSFSVSSGGGDDTAETEAGRVWQLSVQGHRRHLHPGVGYQHPALPGPHPRRLAAGNVRCCTCICALKHDLRTD